MGQFIYSSVVAYKDMDLSWMVGRVITQVLFYDPTPWDFLFGSEAQLRVDCLWRILEDGRIVLTREDHGHQFGLPAPVDAVAKSAELLAGRRITAAQLREGTADMVIEFSGGLLLEVIQNSLGYESWQLRDPSGTSYVAQGGGQLSTWKPDG